MDLGLAFGAGLLLLMVWTVAGSHGSDPPWVSGADFNQYCAIANTARGTGDDLWTGVQRSAFAAMLPGILARTRGLYGGLFTAAQISSFVIGSGLYLWGRALHSRTAGLACVLLTAVFQNMIALRINLDFYPMMIACFCLSSALAMTAVRWPGIPSALASGIAIGLAFLIDVRGLLWGLPALGVTLLGLCAGPLKHWPLRLAAVAVPLAASWPLGRIAYHANALALGQELALYGADTLHLTSAVQAESNAFLWGWGPVGHLFPMLWQSAQINSRVSTTVHADLPPSLAPWITPIAVCALVAILRLIPTPRRLIGFLIMALPSALALWSAIRADRGGRHLDSGFMLIPVILGVVWAELACRRSLVSSLSLRATALGYVLVMVVLLFATDIIDTPLSGYAAAPWMLGSSQEIVDTFVRAQTGILSLSEQWRPCDTGLAWDRSHGLLPSLPPFNNPQP